MKITIAKTMKNYVGGKFVRSESGRSFAVNAKGGEFYANLCLSSRKDFRDAVESSQAGANDWGGRTAFNRSQILYRMAEMTEGKRDEFVHLFQTILGLDAKAANKEVDDAIDSFVYFAGFCDKFSQVVSNVNPINGPFSNVSFPEPMGVVCLVAEKEFRFGRLAAQVSAALTGGNSVILILDQNSDCPAVIAPLSEVFATSDLPGGAVNILTADLKEIFEVMASHMDVRSFSLQSKNPEFVKKLQELSTGNLKRVVLPRENPHSLDAILDTVEIKTIWQPMGF